MQPLHSTALGRCCRRADPVAHSEAVEVDRKAFTPRTVTALDDFEELLDLTRARGWAADVEETWEGVASVAAPIHDRRRMPVGAVAITGAVERVCDAGELRSELVAAVRECARAVSATWAPGASSSGLRRRLRLRHGQGCGRRRPGAPGSGALTLVPGPGPWLWGAGSGAPALGSRL